MTYTYNKNELYHWGIKGQKWGIRRFQNEDGSYTAKGQAENNGHGRYSDSDTKSARNKKNSIPNGKKDQNNSKSFDYKKALKIGAVATVTALAAYGGYKLYQNGAFDYFAGKGKKSVMQYNNLHGIILEPAQAEKLDSSKLAELAKDVNPTRARGNCWSCVSTYLARLVGVDCDVRTEKDGPSFSDICHAFGVINTEATTSNFRIIASPTLDKIEGQIKKKFKDGDAGAISLTWDEAYRNRAGITKIEDAQHTLNFVYKNGIINFVDAQVGIVDGRIKNMLEQNIDTTKEVLVAKLINIYNSEDSLITKESLQIAGLIQ
jgi:hypothetical protein